MTNLITGEKENGKHCRIIAVSIKRAEYEIFDICPYKKEGSQEKR